MRPGIHFTDDPAFAGKRRELTAADIVYSLKRLLDPNLHRGGAQIITDLVVGARAIVDAAKKPGAKFDYDRPMAGLRALDRYTLQLTLTAPNYANIESYLTAGAVAREVVEAAGADIRTRAVGTGPYRLKQWLVRLADRARGESRITRRRASRRAPIRRTRPRCARCRARRCRRSASSRSA